MAAVVLLIGGGDVGLRIADGLLRQSGVERLVLADKETARAGPQAAMLACCHDAAVEFAELDGLDQGAVEALIGRVRPDLIVQAASLISPWSIIGRDHPTAKALNAAGIGVQLPAQFPIVANVMRAVRELDWQAPVANVSMPDIIHPILATRDLSPTVGLGNVSILHLRARAALRQRQGESITLLLRLVGHHKQVYDVMQARPPEDPENNVRVYLGEDGLRDDALAYEGMPFAVGPVYNVITAAAALPVLGALLPGAAPLRFSAPAPQGLPGGYPVRITKGAVSPDLPAGVDLAQAIAFNQRLGALDGVAGVEDDGQVRFTQAAEAAVRDIDPALAESLDPWDMADRTERLLRLVAEMGPL